MACIASDGFGCVPAPTLILGPAQHNEIGGLLQELLAMYGSFYKGPFPFLSFNNLPNESSQLEPCQIIVAKEPSSSGLISV